MWVEGTDQAKAPLTLPMTWAKYGSQLRLSGWDTRLRVRWKSPEGSTLLSWNRDKKSEESRRRAAPINKYAAIPSAIHGVGCHGKDKEK